MVEYNNVYSRVSVDTQYCGLLECAVRLSVLSEP